MAHSNQVREFVLSDQGIDLVDVYARRRPRAHRHGARGAGRPGARRQPSCADRITQRKLQQLATKRKAIEAQIAALQAEAESEAAAVDFAIAQETLQDKTTQQNTNVMANCAAASASDNGRAKARR